MTKEISEEFFFTFDSQSHNNLWREKPFLSDPMYYKTTYVTPRALITMIKHGIRGGRQEIIGYLLGKPKGHEFFVSDAVPTSVLGTETRVGATDEANIEYICLHEGLLKVGRSDFATGWYHSHPSYGCWLSGIDVKQQQECQKGAVFAALVVDPVQTAQTGKVFLGAFRTYPNDYTPTSKNMDNSMIPIDKLKDFGNNANLYYQMGLKYFLTKADRRVLRDIISLSWGEALMDSPLISNSYFISCKVKDQATVRLKNVADGNANAADVESLRILLHEINQDRKAGIIIQKMKKHVFG